MAVHGGFRRLSDVLEQRESIDLDLPIQVPSRPATPLAPAAPLIPVIDLHTGVMDEEVERYLILQAHEIGAEIPPEPGSHKISDDVEVASANVSAVTVSTQDTNTIPSRTSQSTRPTSCDSSIQNDSLQPPPARQQVRPSHSFRRAPASSAASVADSTSSSSFKFLKSFRRLSGLSSFSRKRTSIIGTNSSPAVRPSMESTMSDIVRPSTANIENYQHSTDISDTAIAGRHRRLRRTPSNVSRASSVGAVSLPPMGTAHSYAMSGRNERAAIAAERADRRTLQCPRLQSLRLRQIDEQSQFLDYHTSLLNGIRSRCAKEVSTLTTSYEESKEQLEDSHAQIHVSLEDRHLAAEMELTRALQQERQACDTKLKHMDAYCNGRLSMVDGSTLPRRKVTDGDYRKLVQQYQVRQGMDNLHEARINVLRKKQAKQAERVAQRQQTEYDALHKNFEMECRRKDAAAQREEDELRADFESKRERLQWRWKLMETVECKKLEMETGLSYGEMPDVKWGEHDLIKAMA